MTKGMENSKNQSPIFACAWRQFCLNWNSSNAPAQDCQMRYKNFGKCLSNLWQIFAKKIQKWQCYWQ